MEATLKKQRHQGALIITGPLASPPLTYLSALSGCRVMRTKDAKFAPQRTIQEIIKPVKNVVFLVEEVYLVRLILLLRLLNLPVLVVMDGS